VAFEISQSAFESNWEEVVRIIDGLQRPVKKVREEFEQLAPHIGQSLRNVSELYSTFSNIQYLRDKNIFNLLDAPQNLGICEEDSFYRNLMFINKMKSWILYGYLICPSELEHDHARDLLTVALRDGLYLPIYRDQSLSIHEQFEMLFSKFVIRKFKLSKHKDLLKTAINFATVDAYYQHHSMRCILRAELRSFINLIRDFPGILGPKSDVLWAALSLVRDEIFWYLNNREVDSSKKKIPKDLLFDFNISELFYISDQLVHLARKNKDFIRDFSYEYVRSKLPEVQKVTSELLNSSSLSNDVKDMVESLRNQLFNANLSTPYQELRELWASLSANLADNQNGIASRSAKAFMQMMSKIFHYSKNIDNLEGQINENGSLHLLWFHIEEFNNIVDQTIRSSGQQPRFIISLIRCLDFSRVNCHRFCPEEQLIAEKSMELADQYFEALAMQIDEFLCLIFSKELALAGQILPHDALLRFMENPENFDYPGSESYFSMNSYFLDDLKDCKKALAGFSMAIKESPTVRIYNTKFNPQEYVYDHLKALFQQLYKQIIVSERSAVDRPKNILFKLNSLLNSFDSITMHLNIGLNQNFKETLLNECFDKNAVAIGNPSISSEQTSISEEQEFVVSEIVNFYLNILQNNLEKLGILFSDIHNSFVYQPIDGKPSAAELGTPIEFIEHYFNSSDLKALIQFIGPYGIRAFERKILAIIADLMVAVKGILEQNKTMLIQVSSRLTQTAVWYEAARKLKGLDELLKFTLKISILLKFRKLYLKSYSEVLESNYSDLIEGYRRVRDQADLFRFNEELNSFWSLCEDCGLGEGTLDVNLISALRPLKASKLDDELWRLLPELFGFMLLCPEWRGAYWIVGLNAYSNNGHCVAEAVKSLILSFNCILLPDRAPVPSASSISDSVRKQLKVFTRNASHTVLHMYQQNLMQASFWDGYNLASMQLFLREVSVLCFVCQYD
jgi:hypothetical protein